MSIETGIYNERIKCTVISYSYDPLSRTGKLHLKRDSECDMTGSIKSFKSIDPLVETIQIYNMQDEDVSYKKKNGKWQVCEAKTGAVIAEFEEEKFE